MDFDKFQNPATEAPSAITPAGIAKIAEALAKAQAEISQPTKNKSVTVKSDKGTYSFEYADYNAIVEAVRMPLSKHGICFTHLIELRDRQLVLASRLIHSSGEFLESLYPLPSSNNPKDLGGAITYGKRYCLSAMTGCVADDDVDADPANTSDFGNKKPPQNQAPRAEATNSTALRPVVKPMIPPVAPSASQGNPGRQGFPTEAQLARLFTICTASGWTKEQVRLYMQMRWQIQSSASLTLDQCNELISILQVGTYEQACLAAVGNIGVPVRPLS